MLITMSVMDATKVQFDGRQRKMIVRDLVKQDCNDHDLRVFMTRMMQQGEGHDDAER